MSEIKQTRISNIAEYLGKKVKLQGWIYAKRSSKNIHFLQLRDGSNIIQCVCVKGEIADEEFEKAGTLTQESSVEIIGEVKEDKRSPLGFELATETIRITSLSEDYPITPKEHGVAFLMDHRHLWLRSKRQHAILRIRSELIKAIRDYFDSREFILVDAPILTPAACEGTTTLFETNYFDDKAYLTQSGQLYMEAGAMAHGRVYCFGPTFRAEKSKTRRHLTEFWMVEPEVAYNDLNDNMDLAEDFVVSIVQRVLETKYEELKILERDLSFLEKVQKPFPRITYSEAVEKLEGTETKMEWGKDFGGDEETVLTKMFDRPIFVHRYPAAVKAFYMKRDPDNAKLSLSVDMLAPEGYGEVIGGGQREDSLEVLEKSISEHGLPRQAFEWYLDLRKYGTVPHAGFGLGIERTVAWICGLHHVRETIPFPRMLERLTP